MAIRRQGIWIRSDSQPQPIVNRPDFTFAMNQSVILSGNRRGINFTQANNSANTEFYLNITPDQNTINPVPLFSIEIESISSSTENDNYSFEYDSVNNTIIFLARCNFTINTSAVQQWTLVSNLWNSVPLNEIQDLTNTTFTFRRACSMAVALIAPTDNNTTVYTFTYISNFADPLIISSLPTPSGINFTAGTQNIFNEVYRQTNQVTLTSFLGGGFVPGTNNNLVFPFQGWENIPPGDILNADGSINNLDDLWEIYAVYDDIVSLSPIQFVGNPYKAGEVFSEFFKDYLESIAPPGIKNVKVRTSSNTADNTIVDLIFDKTDGTSNTVQFEIPKPTTPVDIDVNITDKPININVIADDTVIDLQVVDGNKIDIDTTVTNVAFTGSDITNVDLTVEENDINLRTDSTEVIFQHQGSQGLRGTGFTVIFRRAKITPNRPAGGTFNTATNTVTVPDFWSREPTGTNATGTLYVSFGKLEAGSTSIIWTIPTEIAGGTGGGGGGGVGTSFRVAQPINAEIGLIWSRRFTYSQNLRVGNEDSPVWLEIIPGLGDVTLTANGTDAERNNYLILNANINVVDRTRIDFINSDNQGRKE